MKIHVKRTINGSTEDLWSYLADYSNIVKFHPLLSDSHFIEGSQSCEIGSTRQCDLKDGNYIKEKVIEWEEGSHYTVDIYESSLPVKKAIATLGVRPLENGKSEAYMKMDIKSKYAILSPFLFLMYRFYGGPALLKGLEKTHNLEKDLRLA